MSDIDLDALLSERPVLDNDEDTLFSGTVQRKSPLPSDTVLEQGRWNKRKGKELHKEFKEQKLNVDEHVVTDTLTMLFEPTPKYAENPKDAKRAAWVKQLEETPEYRSMKRETCLNLDYSCIASKPICDQWLAVVEQEPEEGGMPGKPRPGEGPGEEQEPIDDVVNRIKSTQEALKKAREELNDAKDFADGIGNDPDSHNRTVNRHQIAKFFKESRNNKRLREIMKLLGRYKRLCQSLQRRKTDGGRGQVTGIELSGDFPRLLPYEMLQIAGAFGPEMRLMALDRYLKRRSLSYKHKKVEQKQQGPFVLCLDGSGSMDESQKIECGKAIAGCLAYLATHQNRWCVLIDFYHGDPSMMLVLPPRHKKQAELIKWLEHFYNGGSTDLHVPLTKLPFELWDNLVEQGLPRGKTDHIIITDAQLRVRDDQAERYNAWAKAEQVSTYGILVDCGRAHGDMDKVCSKCWAVEDMGLTETAVQEVLSI